MSGALLLALLGAALPQTVPDPSRVRAVLDSALAAVERGEGEAALARAASAGSDRTAILRLGALQRLTYRHDEAEATLRPLSDGPPDAVTLRATMELAGLLQRRGRADEARGALGRAASLARDLGDSAAAAEAALGLSGLDVRAGRTASAWAHVARADSLAPAADPVARARVHCQRAALLVFAASPDADDEARRGMALADRAGARRVAGQCLLTLGAGYSQRGLADTAMPLLGAAITRLSAARDHAALAGAYQWRGYLHRTLLRMGHAHLDLTDAIAAAERSDARSPLAWAWLNLGFLFSALRDPATATEHLDAAIAEFEHQGDQWGLHTALLLQSAILTQVGEHDGADDAARRVARWGRATGARATESGAVVRLFESARARGDTVRMAALLDSLDARYARPELRGFAGSLAYDRAAYALATGRLDDAERGLRAQLPALGSWQAWPRFAIHARLAEVLAARGRPGDAAAELARAMDELDVERRTRSTAALRQLVFQGAADEADPDLGVATVLAAVAASGDVSTAFDLAERRRARELGDRLIRAASLTAPADGAAEPARPGWGAASAPPAGAHRFRASLSEGGTAALVYVTGRGDEPTTLFVATADTLVALKVATVDALDPRVSRAVGLLAGRSPGAAGSLRDLFDALVAPALPWLGPTITRLVIVPEDVLHHVPFAALTSPDGLPLAARFAVSLSPSATVHVELRNRPPRDDPVRLLALADPALRLDAPPEGAVATTLRSVFAARGATGSLPGARREARAVGRFAPRRRVLTGAAATESALKGGDLATYRVIHLASHAVTTDASPLRTAIALAPDARDDGFLTAAELTQLDLPADLVVLSACETARGRVIRGEGLQGLAAPLLAAGARAVVASLWDVDDAATARLMRDFYAAMADGAPAADGLALAQRAAIGRGEHAAVWAAFTLIGDPLAAPPLAHPARLPVGLLVAVVAMLLGLAGAAARRRRAGLTGSS
jgi:CHAT domain-containing protein/tetratricopeptide (TPR) repeat protein